MSDRIESLDELHRLIREGRVEQDEALGLLQDLRARGADGEPTEPSAAGGAAEPPTTAMEPVHGTADLVETVRGVVLDRVCALLKVDPSDLEADVELTEYGLDSLIISQLVAQVNEELGLDLVPTTLFEYPTLRRFS
ncbi:acyl carrier protein, partial [Nocardiopsis sp. MG754419]|uniref:acyl carrier protein n=1 Tax=Nocardiopsis sp. MG754419 TaxID=2259865 RepID=UPI001BA5CAFB